jgi:hypothetical protein
VKGGDYLKLGVCTVHCTLNIKGVQDSHLFEAVPDSYPDQCTKNKDPELDPDPGLILDANPDPDPGA